MRTPGGPLRVSSPENKFYSLQQIVKVKWELDLDLANSDQKVDVKIMQATTEEQDTLIKDLGSFPYKQREASFLIDQSFEPKPGGTDPVFFAALIIDGTKCWGASEIFAIKNKSSKVKRRY
ncbi:hypothetical protein G9A89_020536 [Geosiphon pyriformis]|nr:hypothetical protein G9A89_020536 [Geosiphon pyriformis]